MQDKGLSWNSVGKQAIGRWGEWYAAMALVRRGLDLYVPFVDERGVDLVVRVAEGNCSRFIELQVKTVRLPQSNYVFFRKKHFHLSSDRYAVLVVLREDVPEPDVFLIPSLAWSIPNEIFVSRDYAERKSDPEYGLPLNRRAMLAIERYRISAKPTFEDAMGV
jgi:hypothetical protein